jgi:hypothetical protein
MGVIGFVRIEFQLMPYATEVYGANVNAMQFALDSAEQAEQSEVALETDRTEQQSKKLILAFVVNSSLEPD